MSLYTGKILQSYIWEKLPIDTNVIRRVETLAGQENQPMTDGIHQIF